MISTNDPLGYVPFLGSNRAASEDSNVYKQGHILSHEAGHSMGVPHVVDEHKHEHVDKFGPLLMYPALVGGTRIKKDEADTAIKKAEKGW